MLSPAEAAIFDRARHPLFEGKIEGATHTAEGANLSCGDEIRWEARVENEKIEVLRHTCRACALCQASADLLVERLEGKPLTELQKLTPEEILAMVAIPLSPTRAKCALLPYETLLQILKQTQV